MVWMTIAALDDMDDKNVMFHILQSTPAPVILFNLWNNKSFLGKTCSQL